MPTTDEIIRFSSDIEKFASESKTTIMDAIITYCEKNSMEIEMASSLISEALKQKIRKEAQELNLLSKANTLPL